MNQFTIIRGAVALPFLLFGSVALAQGAQEPSGAHQGGSQTESLRQQDEMRGSQAGRTGTSGTRQGQQGMQRGTEQEATQRQQEGMEQPAGQREQAQRQRASADASFQNVDKDGNGEISRSELRQATQSVASKWDHDQDGKVTHFEALGGIFQGVDKNGDDSIDEQEFQAVQQKWMPQGQEATFSEWDGDSDGKLSYMEFADGLVTSEVARKFDQNRDSRVTERELQNGLLSTLDRDGNNRLDEQEWPLN